MDAYETLGMLGEGTYGVVIKARHRATSRMVAIKKYKQAEDDDHVRKTSLREVRVLKQLRHPNVIALLDVFRRDGKLYLVFEYVENTILQLIEEKKYGLPPDDVRRYTFQLLNGVSYCHAHNIIHRDVKPENILVSKDGVLKLCDFGFARQLSCRGNYTDYVATRWYRAPELLVGDVSYGKAVDVWAIGCVFSELSDGQPLFPGDSDLDQLSLIMRTCGPVPQQMISTFEHNSLYRRVTFPQVKVEETLQQHFHSASEPWLEFLTACLRTDPVERPSCTALMSMPYFTENNFRATYEAELRELFQRCHSPLMDPAPNSPVQNYPWEQQQQQQQQQPLGGDRVDAELTLPRLAAPSHDAEPNEKVASAGSKTTMLGVSSEVAGGVGGSVVVDSNSNSFHQLGVLWNHFMGSNVGAVVAASGELPNIGPRQSHPHPSGPPPGVQVAKTVPRSGTNSVGDKTYSGMQGMKVTGCLGLGAKNVPKSPEGQTTKTSAAQNGSKVKQARSDVKPEPKREWKSCSALGKSVKPNHLFPLLQNGTNNPGVAPSGGAVVAGPSLQDGSSPVVTRALCPPSSNGAPGASPPANGSPTPFSTSKDGKKEAGGAGSTTNGSGYKQRRKTTRRSHDQVEVEGLLRIVSDKSGCHPSGTGPKCSVRDGAPKR